MTPHDILTGQSTRDLAALHWLQAGESVIPALAPDLYELITERAGRSLILTSNRSPISARGGEYGVARDGWAVAGHHQRGRMRPSLLWELVRRRATDAGSGEWDRQCRTRDIRPASR